MSSTGIGDHALLSDRHSSALVDRSGSVEWLSFPRFDSPSIFGRLLGPDAGHWQIAPAGEWSTTRRYVDRTLVLETTFTTPTGVLVLTDLLALGPDNGGHRLGIGVPHLFVRRLVCTAGEVEVEISYAPRPEYGLMVPLLATVDGGVTARGGAEWLVHTSPIRYTLERGTASGRTSLRAGDIMHFALHRSTLEETPARIWSQQELAALVDNTVTAWRSWSGLHQVYEGPWRDLVRPAVEYCRGCRSSRAARSWLPPRPRCRRASAGSATGTIATPGSAMPASRQALWVAACPDEAADFFAFLTTAAASSIGPDSGLQIMFGVGGEHDLSERELPHLPGWKDSRPVRVGNGAWNQRQIDVYGELLGAADTLSDQILGIDDDTRRFLIACADTAATHWVEKDSGIWEIRGDTQHFVYSKVMCWVALDR